MPNLNLSTSFRRRTSVAETSHLLLVDDDPILLTALTGTLENHLGHYSLNTCSAATTAVDLLKTRKYDTVISDVNMPGMSGLELLETVTRSYPTTPVVLMSGSLDRVMIAKALEAGAVNVLTKPFARDVFVHTIRQTLNLSRLHARLDQQRASIGRMKRHFEKLLLRLSDHTDNWIEASSQADGKSVLSHARSRHESAQRRLRLFGSYANRHLAMLDIWLDTYERAQQETLQQLHEARETLQQQVTLKLQ